MTQDIDIVADIDTRHISVHDDTSNQVPARTIGRYALGLPVSVALIGVASVEQLRENVSAARDVPPLTAEERKALEDRIG